MTKVFQNINIVSTYWNIPFCKLFWVRVKKEKKKDRYFEVLSLNLCFNFFKFKFMQNNEECVKIKTINNMGKKATVSNNCNISLKEQQSLLMRQLEWSNCVKYQSCILQNSLLVVGPCKLELKYISRPTTLISQNSLLRDLYFNPGFSLQKIKRRKKKN